MGASTNISHQKRATFDDSYHICARAQRGWPSLDIISGGGPPRGTTCDATSADEPHITQNNIPPSSLLDFRYYFLNKSIKKILCINVWKKKNEQDWGAAQLRHEKKWNEIMQLRAYARRGVYIYSRYYLTECLIHTLLCCARSEQRNRPNIKNYIVLERQCFPSPSIDAHNYTRPPLCDAPRAAAESCVCAFNYTIYYSDSLSRRIVYISKKLKLYMSMRLFLSLSPFLL